MGRHSTHVMCLYIVTIHTMHMTQCTEIQTFIGRNEEGAYVGIYTVYEGHGITVWSLRMVICTDHAVMWFTC